MADGADVAARMMRINALEAPRARAMRAVLESALRAHEKLVMLAILDHWSADRPRPYPSIDRIVALTSASRSTVLRVLESLEQAGTLGVERTGYRGSNVYDLGAALEARLPGLDQSQGDTGVTETPVSEGLATGVTGTFDQSQEDTGSGFRLTPEAGKGSEQGKGARKGASARTRATKRSSSREAPIPGDWTPSEAHRTFAAEHGLDLELEAVAFRGRFEGQKVASPNGRFTTWLANEAKWRRQRDIARAPAGRLPHARGTAPAHRDAEYPEHDSDPMFREQVEQKQAAHA